ncbi:DinB family protein [Tenacibaculum sp. UWU-22]|uniref:DinB family protein n=1 Tax=Tenacibaculum sp. UWU-22 TaxID=3234187 RepID=UPI0034DB4337
MEAQNLINELLDLTLKNLKKVEALKELSIKKLNQRQHAKSWSALECIEHLNRYGDFYIPEIKKGIEKSNYKKSNVFISNFLGSYFAKSMLPKEKLNKMKTFKTMNPINSFLDKTVLDKFIHQQEEILELLEKSTNTDLTNIKTPISITKWIKLKLGDTFRVLVYHNVRHIIQAENTLKS